MHYSFVYGCDIPEEEGKQPLVVQFRTIDEHYVDICHIYMDYGYDAEKAGYNYDYSLDLIPKHFEYKKEKAERYRKRDARIREEYQDFLKTGWDGKFTKKAFSDMTGYPYQLVIRVTNMPVETESTDGEQPLLEE